MCLYRCTKFENNCGIPVPATTHLMVCRLLEPIELAARYFMQASCETCAKCYAERGQKKSTAALEFRPRPREVATEWCVVVFVHLIQPGPGVSKQMGTFSESTSPPGPCFVGKVSSIFGRVCRSCSECWRPVSSWLMISANYEKKSQARDVDAVMVHLWGPTERIPESPFALDFF